VAKLILVRHGESAWNAKGLWTGWTDISLSEKGRAEAAALAAAIQNVPIDICYTSLLTRAKETLTILLHVLGKNPKIIEDKALNERNYGDYTGKNKWEIKKLLGEEAFTKLRRSWDYPIPNGETLKDVAARALPYYKEHIFPQLMSGKNVLVVAHGNSIRAMMKGIENIPDEDIASVEIATGEAAVYTFDNSGLVVNKERIKANTPT
jgi:2,3-bisphosphoglycerate-dependent phosphoglycerate mutase